MERKRGLFTLYKYICIKSPDSTKVNDNDKRSSLKHTHESL